MKLFKGWLIALWFLNAYDAAITVYVTQWLGAYEMNPCMRLLLNISPTLFVAVKLVLMTVICWLMHKKYKKGPEILWTTLCILVGFYVSICIWNTSIVFS
jgi:hypothetical protein